MLDTLSFLFSHAFMLRALVVGGLISLCCALLGVSLVLKRFSMIGDGLSHVGFGALAIACAANIAPLYFSIPIVILAAFALLAMNEKGKLKGDAAIALISTGALAVGVMVTSMTTGMNVDIYNYMFGDGGHDRGRDADDGRAADFKPHHFSHGHVHAGLQKLSPRDRHERGCVARLLFCRAARFGPV